ncbi:GlxA family transcriptional regulator, partial [Pseudomonas aeruginosa]|nr:GlxA family transcriptional regulator [Pseudomonas aeruginosa]
MERRRFSAALQGQNLRFTGAGEGGSARARVGFLLLEHFSLPAFTQALDTLVTANLIRSESFAVSNFSLSGEPVTSDLGLLICPDLALASAALQGLDLLVVCGGLRTPLRSSAALLEA